MMLMMLMVVEVVVRCSMVLLVMLFWRPRAWLIVPGVDAIVRFGTESWHADIHSEEVGEIGVGVEVMLL